jgi:uncharacterized protein YdhG (YjbR/CyaY superfamily)
MKGITYLNPDQYIDSQEASLQEKLTEMREILRDALPEASEIISYGMPGFKFKEVLVYYAVTKKHLGFYPTSNGVAAFAGELAAYNTSKGTIRFPLNEPLPHELIASIARFRMEEVLKAQKCLIFLGF